MSDKPKAKNETQNELFDPFDPKALRLTESAQLNVEKVQTVISCGKPNRQQFVRVHPSEEYRMQTALFTDEVNREAYLVAPELWDDWPARSSRPFCLPASPKPRTTCSCGRCGCPIPMAGETTGTCPMLRAAELAMSKWVRVQANMADGKYDVFEATGNIPDPEWPDMSFRDMLICVSVIGSLIRWITRF